MQRSVISVIIPAYNEEKTIGSVIEETTAVMDSLQVPYEIIIVDDGSTDKTKQIAMNHKAIVVSNERRRGKGYAVRNGFQHAQGDLVVTIDADGAHRAKEIPDLLVPLFNGADIVAGSRFLGSDSDFTSGIHRIGNFIFNTTIKTLTGKQVTDSQTGFRAIKREVLEKLNLDSTGFEIESEITVKGLRNSFVFIEKPITCERRKYDISRVNILSDGTRILRAILKSNFSKIEH